MARAVSDKRSSLLRTFANCCRKKFYNVDARCSNLSWTNQHEWDLSLTQRLKKADSFLFGEGKKKKSFCPFKTFVSASLTFLNIYSSFWAQPFFFFKKINLNFHKDLPQPSLFRLPKHQATILKGEELLYHWPPVWLVWISLFCK